jgi:peptidyl-dipeptidase Dcp
MQTNVRLEDITIRTQLQPGDIGFVTYLHGVLYSREYEYGLAFESYVAKGLHEFISNHNPEKDGVWVCEHNNRIIGFLLLMDRKNFSAQLRFFIIKPEYRGIGLGKKLMDELMKRLRTNGYKHIYLWTTHEQQAAAYLYMKRGFRLMEEKDSTSFGKPLKEQRYDLFI